MILKILTYNIWFSNYYINERLKKLLLLIEKEEPDIICLQEVRKDVLAVLVNKLFKYNYWETSLNEEKNYGIAIFSKLKKKNTKIYKFKKTNMDRHFLIIELEDINGNIINIATTHLESEFNTKNIENSIKYYQFDNLLKFLKKKKNIILCGDMNISVQEDNYYIIDDVWNDCWILDGLNKDKKYTYDCIENIYINKKTNYRSRLDRIYIKENEFKLMSYNLVGKGENIIPSDHFGIIVKIEL
jgi:tyrosyl-DNA phosphodiesterase 2